MKLRSVFKVTFALVAVVLVVVGLGLLNSFKRYDLLFNPIVNEITNDERGKRWGERVPLIPAQFASGEQRDGVLEKLNDAGFGYIPNSQLWSRYQSEVDLGREVFSREASRFPCNIRVYVFIGFDEQGSLEFAEGTQHEHGCL